MHGHPPGEDAPRGAVVRRCGTVEDLGVTRGARQMNILVTGHSGYIGTVLTQMLLRAGHSVVGIVMGLYATCTFGSDPRSEERRGGKARVCTCRSRWSPYT